MKRYIYSIFALLIFASTCYAHDPSKMIFLFAQYGVIAISTFLAPVIVIAFCTVKLTTAFIKSKSKISTLIFNWILPVILALAASISFSILWLRKYGINSILEPNEFTLYFWFGSVAIATIELFLLLAIWYKKKTQIQNRLFQYVSKCYNGEEKLFVVFWIWNIVIFNGLAYIYFSASIIVIIIFNLLNIKLFNLYELSTLKLIILSLFLLSVLFFVLIFVIYTYWLILSIIRSYKSVGKRIWFYLAVIILLLEICYYVMLIIMFSKEFISS